ncbi:STAS domain-containing protein [Streptomyces sp. NPDC093225]|uniref:STAS domain-containing protein n=1 Tax=Streptomyces sp. NPDC093225 TaxID=3366034 RepID=UPI00381389E0
MAVNLCVTITEEMPLPGPALRTEDTEPLCAALAERYRRGAAEVVCDLAGLTAPGLPTLDALARLALTARRHGGSLRLTGAPPGLAALLELSGLGDVLAQQQAGQGDAGQGDADQRQAELRQPLRQAEEGEPPVGVQERVEPDDPPA